MDTSGYEMLMRLRGAGLGAAGRALDKLGGGASLGASTGLSGAGVEGGSFAELLQRAASGKLSSGREVRLGRDAGVELSAEQLQRVGLATDKAEASGFRRAMVMIDRQVVVVDVELREVVGAFDPSRGGTMSGLDGVVAAPDAAGSAVGSADGAAGGAGAKIGAVALGLPGAWGTGAGNTSLSALLAKMAEEAKHAESTRREEGTAA
jgi:hypothetical protein